MVLLSSVLLIFTESLLCAKSYVRSWGVRMSNAWSQGAKEVSTAQCDECHDSGSSVELEELESGIKPSPRKHFKSTS